MDSRPENSDPYLYACLCPDHQNDTDHHVRILSLDGGGVRGLSSLLILKRLMQEIQRKTKSDRLPHPSEYFDLIGGTSTGGLIALMLGRLGMVRPPYTTSSR